jgi:hypothetical protein
VRPEEATGARAATAPPEQRVIGDYRLERRIGRGAMGEVWLGYHLETGVRAAVKLLRPDLAGKGRFVRLFARERRAVARLNHPHIVGVFDVGPQHLATAYIDGTTLARRLEAPIDPAAAVAIALQIASALAHAHARGVVHRDVKPSNILIDRSGNAYLADFGLAALSDEDEAGEPGGGTPQFMAPEQSRGETVDATADQYALGRTLAEMLAGGRVPTDRAAALAQLPATLPPPLVAAVARATAARPAERWPTVEAFAAALLAVDLAGAAAPARLLPEVRVAAPFAWAAAPVASRSLGAGIVKADFRVSDLERAGLLPAAACARFRERTGLRDVGWSVVGSTSRLGPITSPHAVARASELVVFVHGALCTREIWVPTAAPIARDNPQALLLLPDVAGFGETTYQGAPAAGLRPVVDAVLAWLELLGVRELPMVLVGHSMGAMALLTISAGELGPRTSRVAVTPVFPSFDPAIRRTLGASARLLPPLGRFAPSRALLGHALTMWAPQVRHYTAAERRRNLVQFRRTPIPVLTQHVRSMLGFQPVTGDDLGRCVFMAGQADPLSPLPVLREALGSLGVPPTALQVLAIDGHYVQGEQEARPEATVRTIHEIVALIGSLMMSVRDGTLMPTQLESTLLGSDLEVDGSTAPVALGSQPPGRVPA